SRRPGPGDLPGPPPGVRSGVRVAAALGKRPVGPLQIFDLSPSTNRDKRIEPSKYLFSTTSTQRLQPTETREPSHRDTSSQQLYRQWKSFRRMQERKVNTPSVVCKSGR